MIGQSRKYTILLSMGSRRNNLLERKTRRRKEKQKKTKRGNGIRLMMTTRRPRQAQSLQKKKGHKNNSRVRGSSNVVVLFALKHDGLFVSPLPRKRRRLGFILVPEGMRMWCGWWLVRVCMCVCKVMCVCKAMCVCKCKCKC